MLDTDVRAMGTAIRPYLPDVRPGFTPSLAGRVYARQRLCKDPVRHLDAVAVDRSSHRPQQPWSVAMRKEWWPHRRTSFHGLVANPREE